MHEFSVLALYRFEKCNLTAERRISARGCAWVIFGHPQGNLQWYSFIVVRTPAAG